MKMSAQQFQAKIAGDGAASFWLQRQIQTASQRDVLDALIDAEALAAFCELRAREAGLNINPREKPIEDRAYCPRCEVTVHTIDDGATCASCKLVL